MTGGVQVAFGRHAPAMSAKIMGVETLDHPTDDELVASSRKYFESDHQT
jgi:hypothetical protein